MQDGTGKALGWSQNFFLRSDSRGLGETQEDELIQRELTKGAENWCSSHSPPLSPALGVAA